MTIDVLMPQMGESIAEGTITRWLKKVGDTVDRDEPLFEISTDKVDAEIPSPAAGVVSAIRVPEGGTAEVNSVVAVIQTEGTSGMEGPPEGGPHESPVPHQAPNPNPAPVPHQAPGTRHQALAKRATPLARVLAFEHRIDLASVTGSGGHGRVLKADVLSHLAGPGVASGFSRKEAGAAASGGSRKEPMSVMRRKIAEHMIASRRTSAHVYSVFEVNCGRIEDIRKAKKAEFEKAGAKLSVLPFVVLAAARALREMPVINASLAGDNIVYHRDINVGVAVALETGLIVPVVKNADGLSLLDVARGIADLAQRARGKQLKPHEVAGGTFTITNPGNFGGSFATPIINQPQVAILELGTVEKRVVVINDALAVRPMMNLTLGFDHRLIDGAAADRFLAAVKKTLETWSDN